MSEAFAMDNSDIQSLYFSDRIPAEIAENMKELFPDHGELSYEEVLLEQESAYYYYIQSSGQNMATSSSSQPSINRNPSLVQDGESSNISVIESQLALDEALARSLQELGEDFEDLYLSEHSGHIIESRESIPRETTPVRVTTQNVRQDDIDPDNMTYEELQRLGEAVGHQSKGLSEDLISRLPTFKFKDKTGLFFKKKNKEEHLSCVICCSEYKNGARLITLPCAHQYHAECISRWLKQNKILTPNLCSIFISLRNHTHVLLPALSVKWRSVKSDFAEIEQTSVEWQITVIQPLWLAFLFWEKFASD
ncbi:OLC1v1027349C1 [Oldenlandia corymbosa var. corymbosa]|uniref:OLC1v1027349C1 n=1 Tax=Oldenlandia corymbosa var. corymbosa TaxID=529605 RepID=A0AAV1C9A4_OLDCO|nr:OLC1v1027349C1 [Oldenlandia corymbosa var. corymbosa]